jgi:hypothetical protein
MVLAHLFRNVIDVLLGGDDIYYAVWNAGSLPELCGLRKKKYPSSARRPTNLREG